MSDVIERVDGYVLDLARARGREHVSHDEELIELGILDSISIARLVQFLEESFGIEVRDEDIVPETFGTLRGIHALVERRRSSNRVA